MITAETIIALKQFKGVGNKTIFKIANLASERVDSPETLYELLSKNKIGKNLCLDDVEGAYTVARRIIERSAQEGIGVLPYFDEAYPEILRQCVDEKGKLDPPILLYYRGNLEALKRPGVAVIGTREPTANGVVAGKYFAAQFAQRGYNIVSGLAIGCDTTGHEGALSVEGVTTAFLSTGLEWRSIYPQENVDLAKRIVEKNGILLSEYAIGENPGRFGFVARDRLQAGLACATIVVQTGEKGGTMHAVTATLAAGKPLFAVEYKNEVDVKHEKVQGNIQLVKKNQALPLRSKELEAAIATIEAWREKSVEPNDLFGNA